MKRLSLLIALLFIVALGASSCIERASARTIAAAPAQRMVVDVSIFYDDLAPYGRWFSLDDYGWVWTPSGVPVGWRPYTNGYWIYTDCGWTWVSRWRWGWAPFHYGRWFFHRNHGWVWRPGREWAPAWVVWRHGPGWVGWAPMPPTVEWQVGIGLRAQRGDVDAVIEPHWYSFVEERHFADRDLERRLELSARNVTHFRHTENVTNYVSVENRVINRSINPENIERAAGRSILRHRVVDGDSPGRGVEARGSDVILYRPTIERGSTDRAPRQIEMPARKPSTAEQIRRLEENERRRLETEQARERRALENRQRIERTRPTRQVIPDEINRRHENERRALEEQKRREQQILKNRQEQQRKIQPATPAPTRTEKDRKPTPERRPMPKRKP